jgi:hypothetical protein
MRINAGLFREIALFFFAALGICTVTHDVLTKIMSTYWTENKYSSALLITVLMLGLKHFGRRPSSHK